MSSAAYSFQRQRSLLNGPTKSPSFGGLARSEALWVMYWRLRLAVRLGRKLQALQERATWDTELAAVPQLAGFPKRRAQSLSRLARKPVMQGRSVDEDTRNAAAGAGYGG